MKNTKIVSLQGLRMIMFLLIFFFHACEVFTPESWFFNTFLRGGGCLPVSVFFVISGFVSGLSNRQQINGFREYLRYMKDKATKFYPMHWFFLIIMMPLRYSFFLKGATAVLFTILNAFLLHSWVPDKVAWISLNGVTWYLSATMFLYAVTPALQIFYSKLESRRNKNSLLGAVIGCCVAICFILPFFIKTNVSYWLYAFPPVRVLDYAAGFFLSKVFKDKSVAYIDEPCSIKTQILYTSKELLAFVLIILFLIGFPYFDEGFRRSAIQLPLSLFLVYTVAQSKGFLSKGLSLPIMVKAGNYSLYYMMCHLAAISFFHIGIWYDFLRQWFWMRWILVFASLFAVIISKPIYDYIMTLVSRFFHNKRASLGGNKKSLL